EVVVDDRREALPDRIFTVQAGVVLLPVVVVEGDRHRVDRLDRRDQVKNATLAGQVAGLIRAVDAVRRQGDLVGRGPGDVPHSGDTADARHLIPAHHRPTRDRDLVGDRIAHEGARVGEGDRVAEEERAAHVEVRPRLDYLGPQKRDELPALDGEAF